MNPKATGKIIMLWAGIFAVTLLCSSADAAKKLQKVLVFDKWSTTDHTTQQRAGDSLIARLSRQIGFQFVVSSDAAQITDANLAQYQVIVFNNNGYDFLPLDANRNALIKWVNNGGGCVAWHAADANHQLWPWWCDSLIGADLVTHVVATARVYSETKNVGKPAYDSLMKGVTPSFNMNEEWYNLSPDPSKNSAITILQLLDETSYSGGTMGGYHSMSWCREYGPNKARMVYSAIGHEVPSYTNANFVQFISNALTWASKDSGNVTSVVEIPRSIQNRVSALPEGYSLFDHGSAMKTFLLNGRATANRLRSNQIVIRDLNDRQWIPVLQIR